ncbi:hypothetical protein [Pedobacter rhodius]|uniref:Coproporphyrinogen III oxidase n=1 Tax=Pedobacter rhodius TaxID=3004098 RepID=A0ABT4KW32_9SPHI|nr:hypothetical protein [Pedobacter sp. SJ11]MCZ4223122.1 hypothetical protein [Pedobacter sp. SJ11]
MKNAFKLGFLALALSLSVVACSEKKAEGADSTAVDSTVVDTTVKDTSKMDTSKMDTTKMDTTKKM